MEWTNNLIFEFINLYHQEPTLWNYTTPEHKNRNDANDAWNRIKSKLKNGTIPIKEIKKKRDNLMSTYRRQRTKVRESLCSGLNEIYKPEWPFYNMMATFLDDMYKPRKTKYSKDLLDYEDAQDEENPSVNENEEGSMFNVPEKLHKKTPKRSKLKECDEINKRSEEPHNLKELAASDICSLYCNLLCNKLRALKEDTRDIAMMEIDKLIYILKQQETHSMENQHQATTSSIVQQQYHTPTTSGSQPAFKSFVTPSFQQLLHQQIPSAQGISHSSKSQLSQHQQISHSPPRHSYSPKSQSPSLYVISCNSPPSPGYSHSSNSQSSPTHLKISPPLSLGYSHSSNSQP